MFYRVRGRVLLLAALAGIVFALWPRPSLSRQPDVAPGRPLEHSAKELDGLEKCLERVPPRLKQLIQMRYHLSFSTEEIAERVDQSAAWVRTTLCRLRRQLKDCVQDKMATEKA